MITNIPVDLINIVFYYIDDDYKSVLVKEIPDIEKIFIKNKYKIKLHDYYNIKTIDKFNNIYEINKVKSHSNLKSFEKYDWKNIILNSITHLTFDKYFNESVNNLPNFITHLTFGNNFNQNVDNLPNSITHL